jgi:hypothetical protein
MSKNYRLDLIKTDGMFPSVRIIFDYNIQNFSEPLDLAIVQEWCTENENGWRTSYDTFKFRNQEQLLMFVMRWS